MLKSWGRIFSPATRTSTESSHETNLIEVFPPSKLEFSRHGVVP